MNSFDLPFVPIRSTLYGPDELFAGFVQDDPTSFARTTDFGIYRAFVAGGGAMSGEAFGTMMQSLHDNAITQARRAFLHGRRCVAIMGGHKLLRDSRGYAAVAGLARSLTRAGFTLASGGGPGAMEATHLGARFSTTDDDTFSEALGWMRSAPELPKDLARVVNERGEPDMGIVAKAHAWLLPAWKASRVGAASGSSLAVPTWHYGHEPSTPLASGIAKYFQNSVREDGLLAIAHGGIVYTEGKAGTTQEVFQDATQNYYRSFGRFSPMVFLGVDYWTNKIPVRAVLQALFTADDFATHVLFTDEPQEVEAFLLAYDRRVNAAEEPMKKGYPTLANVW